MHIYPEKIDKTDLRFNTNSDLVSIEYNEPCWYFTFENEISVAVEASIWRILQKNKILRTSEDHMQKFGLPQPVNLVEEIEKVLADAHLLQIKVDEDTGDLHLVFSDNIEMQILITSSGYESYSFSFDGKRYIGGGSGEISVYSL